MAAKQSGFCSGIQALSWLRNSHETFGKQLNSFESQLPHLYNRDKDSTNRIELVSELNVLTYMNFLKLSFAIISPS